MTGEKQNQLTET